MSKKIIIILLLLFIFIYTITSLTDISKFTNEFTREYLLKNAFSETSSKNLVAAVYLDYRLLDTIFEAALLLIAATGVLFMVQRND
ncbi:MAG: hypothetical protein COA82_06525 [Alkaliphilus sp.]|nr:hypothetical protein [Alkaliphilus sp. AH-315-G20]MBN4067633.1 hypothetical protein [Alkaliphilus transvaalensis]PHS34880.1 MAG: hypothetical protein COA82_06525 [Alkaliphilus sp.]